MTNEERKVFELALEALETPWNAPYVDGCDLALGKRVKAITAIKESLAQPDQDEVDIRSRLYQRIHELENQLAQPEQGPLDTPLPCDVKVGHVTIRKGVALSVLVARMQVLYDMVQTTPPQRPWVGLTDEEIDQGLLRSNHALQTAGTWRDGVEWATKQLREKNNG